MMRILAFKNKKPTDNVPQADVKKYMSSGGFVWVDIENGSKKDYDFIQEAFDIHPLTLEDMKSAHSVPKIDMLQDRYMFVVFRSIYYDKKVKRVKTDEIDFCLGKNFLITVHDAPFDSVNTYIKRLMAGSIKVRTGADSLLHHILDVEVDGFLRTIDDMDDEVERLGARIARGEGGKLLQKLTDHRRQISNLKKVVAPERDIVNRLSRGESLFVSKPMLFYFRDVYDHMFRFHLNLDAHREMLANTMETYNSAQANQTNQVVKQLTIIATIFLPLTFITGVYGMNFQNMPELGLDYGYYMVVGVMTAIALGMWIYFKRKY